MLEAQLRTFPKLDVDAALEQIVWKEARRYRVAITVDKPHLTAERRRRSSRTTTLMPPVKSHGAEQRQCAYLTFGPGCRPSPTR